MGLEIDTVAKKFFIPESKLLKIKTKLSEILTSSKSKVWVRKLASVVGLIQSCARALGPATRFHTRSTYSSISGTVEKFGWDGFLFLTDESSRELTFWLDNIEMLNGYSFSSSRSEITVASAVEVVSDASSIGEVFWVLFLFVIVVF